jgi:hypothetical protein
LRRCGINPPPPNSKKPSSSHGVLAPVVSLVIERDFPPARGVEELLPAATRQHLLRHRPRRRLDAPVPIVARIVDYVFAEGVEGDHALLLEGRGLTRGLRMAVTARISLSLTSAVPSRESEDSTCDGLISGGCGVSVLLSLLTAFFFKDTRRIK